MRSGPARSNRPCLPYSRKLGCFLILSCILATLGGAPPAHGEPGTPQGTARPSKASAWNAAEPHAPALSVASLGSSLQDKQQAASLAPFSRQSGVQVELHGWDGTLATLQAQAQTRGSKTRGDKPGSDKTGSDKIGGNKIGSDTTDAGGWDLVLMEAAPLRVACRQGLFLSRPLTMDPADTAPDSSGKDCGVHAWQMDLVLVWDQSRVDTTPNWADFWDVARRPGKRGLRRDPRGTLEIALMADGVAPDDVYRTLATSEGVDRAFRKLDQLRPYIVWWNTPAEAVQIIDGGAVLMTSAPNDEVVTADQAGHRSFGMQWAQSLGMSVDWGIPRATTSEHRAQAQRLLTFLVDPARRPASPSTNPGLSEPRVTGEKLPQASSTPAVTQPAPPQLSTSMPGSTKDKPASQDQQRATLMMDDNFWTDHLVPLRQRMESWIELK